MAAVRVTVRGRVQGVSFRAWTVDQANSLGVCGWVRNDDDGSVEAHLEGEKAAVFELTKRMRRGPDPARVEDLEAIDVEAANHRSFTVRR